MYGRLGAASHRSDLDRLLSIQLGCQAGHRVDGVQQCAGEGAGVCRVDGALSESSGSEVGRKLVSAKGESVFQVVRLAEFWGGMLFFVYIHSRFAILSTVFFDVCMCMVLSEGV